MAGSSVLVLLTLLRYRIMLDAKFDNYKLWQCLCFTFD